MRPSHTHAHPIEPVETADPLLAFRMDRFLARGRALFVGHVVLIGFGAASLTLVAPGHLPGIGACLLASLLAASAARLLLAPNRYGVATVWVALCVDCALLVLLLRGTGGLFSPLVGLQPALVGAFRLVLPGGDRSGVQFGSAIATSPAFLVLPLALGGEGIDGTEGLLLLGYGALGAAIAWGLDALGRAEERSHLQVLALEAKVRLHLVEEERARLSREIHDGVGAALTSLVLQAEWGQRPGADPADALGELRRTAEDAVDDLRRSLRHLRRDFDLVEALGELCDSFGRRHGLGVSWQVVGDASPLGPVAELAFFRILQESLTNVLRHASATRVEVRLCFGIDGAGLSIEDDGKGFDPSSPRPGRFGLRGMRERASSVGGRLTIGPGQGGSGTRIELLLPQRKERP